MHVVRTREDVDCTLDSAKLETNELHNTAQCLYISADMDNDAVKLIEMDNRLLDSLLAGQWSVQIVMSSVNNLILYLMRQHIAAGSLCWMRSSDVR